MTLSPTAPTQGFRIDHLGFQAEYYHPDGEGLELPRETVDLYENKKEEAEIFIHTADGAGFNSRELLHWFLIQTGTRLADHLPAAAKSGDGGAFLVTFPMRFRKNSFHMITDAGATGLKALSLLINVTRD